jgi:hypothetical protein
MDNKKRLFELMNRLDNSFKPRLNEDADIDEGGFSKLKQQMHGLSDSVSTLGVITAENPGVQKLSPEENKRRNNELKKDVRALGLGYSQPDFGMYDNREKPIIIKNISKEDLINLTSKYGQESSIFGSKQIDDQGTYVKWEWIQDGRVVDNETVYYSLTGDEVDSRDNYFTQHKGRKFAIPFFDNLYKSPEEKFKIPTGKKVAEPTGVN